MYTDNIYKSYLIKLLIIRQAYTITVQLNAVSDWQLRGHDRRALINDVLACRPTVAD